MLVKDLLKKKEREIITIEPSVSILQAMGKLIDNKIGCLLVMDPADKLIGIVSDKDIFHTVFKDRENFHEYTVSDIMTTDLIIGLLDDDINYIAGIMTQNRVRHVPILEKDKLVGLVSIGDVIKAQMKYMQIENRYLKLYIDGGYPG